MTVVGGSVLEVLTAGAARGGSLTLLGPGDAREQRSYRELLEQAERAAAGLAAWGARPGDRYATFAATTFDFVIACIAIWKVGGVVAVFATAPRGPRSGWRDNVRAQLDLVCPRAVLTGSRDPALDDELQVVDIDGLSGPPVDLPLPGPADPAMVVLTSGSTAVPKGVLRSHGSLVAGFQFRGVRHDVRTSDHFFSWVPLHFHAFTSSLFGPMSYGVSTTLLPPHLFMAEPTRWLREIGRTRATFSDAPNFAFATVAAHLQEGVPETIDLSCWKVALVTGETIDASVLSRFATATRPFGFDPSALMAGYGMAETGGISCTPRGSGIVTDRVYREDFLNGRATPASAEDPAPMTFVSVGRLYDGVAVSIRDRDGSELSDRYVGEIHVRSPAMMDGYLGDPAATDAVLTDGWFRTGDLGYTHDDDLYVTGRAKNLIIVRGANYVPEDIERLVQSVEGVRADGCAAIGVSHGATEEVVVVAETDDGQIADLDETRKRIANAVWRALGLAPGDVVFVAPGSLPRTSTGKLQRHAVRELYEAGELEVRSGAGQ